MKATPLLELRHVSYSYDKDRPALRDVSAAICPGERIAVLGNNGAGKSTFFLCCNGILRPQKGTVYLEGKTVTYQKQQLLRLREVVCLVFQDPDDQILASTVEAEISFGPMNLGLGIPQVSRRVEEALESMDLQEYRARPPHYLSGGEKKRVTIADILAMKPRLILFDEPTSSLDPQNTARLQQILGELSGRGMALMVATHDIEFAYAWARRVLVFHQGKLLADCSPREVFSNEALMEQVGLKKPILYAVSQAICAAKGVSLPRVLPKTIEEFPTFYKEMSE